MAIGTRTKWDNLCDPERPKIVTVGAGIGQSSGALGNHCSIKQWELMNDGKGCNGVSGSPSRPTPCVFRTSPSIQTRYMRGIYRAVPLPPA